MRRTLLLSAFASALALPLSAQTQVTSGTSPDYLGPLGIDSQGTPLTAIAQTFALPSGTNYLQSFTFFLASQFNGNQLFLQAAVYQFAGDQLTGPALFTSALFAGSGNTSGSDPFTFGTGASPLNVLLAPNLTYAFVLTALNGNAATPDGSTVQANLAAGDTYAPGALYYSMVSGTADLFAPGAFASLDGTTDVAFNATFTAAPVVSTPEPGTIVLVASGLAGIGGVVRRRRGSAQLSS
jgi:PEP-CTERM motif-containing protein